MLKQARDRQFEYLNAQQGVLEDESGDESWSNPHGGRDLVEMSDLVPLRCDFLTTTIDNDETLMQINTPVWPTCSVASDYYVKNI